MSRSRVRVCLQDGLRLDLNRLARKGFIKFGTNIGLRGIAWTNSYWGVVHGVISADMSNQHNAWLRIQIGDSIQQITLASRSRHFGGHQWFFVCPATGRLATVLWKPPGASRFCSLQAWGRQVAYASQFLDRDSRAHHVVKLREIIGLPAAGLKLEAYSRATQAPPKSGGAIFWFRRPAIWPLVRQSGWSLRIPRMGGLGNSVGDTGNAPPTFALSRWWQAPIGEASMFDIVRFKGDLEQLLNRYIAGGPVEDYREMADFLRDVGDQIDLRADEIKAGPRTAGRTGDVVKFPKPTQPQR